MLKIRRPLGRLIFNMGIAIPGKTVFLIETAHWCSSPEERLIQEFPPTIGTSVIYSIATSMCTILLLFASSCWIWYQLRMDDYDQFTQILQWHYAKRLGFTLTFTYFAQVRYGKVESQNIRLIWNLSLFLSRVHFLWNNRQGSNWSYVSGEIRTAGLMGLKSSSQGHIFYSTWTTQHIGLMPRRGIVSHFARNRLNIYV